MHEFWISVGKAFLKAQTLKCRGFVYMFERNLNPVLLELKTHQNETGESWNLGKIFIGCSLLVSLDYGRA